VLKDYFKQPSNLKITPRDLKTSSKSLKNEIATEIFKKSWERSKDEF